MGNCAYRARLACRAVLCSFLITAAFLLPGTSSLARAADDTGNDGKDATGAKLSTLAVVLGPAEDKAGSDGADGEPLDPLAVPVQQDDPPTASGAPFDFPPLPEWTPPSIDVSSLQLPSDLSGLIEELSTGYIQPNAELSLEDAIEIAVAYNHNLNSKRLEAAASLKDVDAIWTEYRPQLGMQAKGYYQDSNVDTGEYVIPLPDGSELDLSDAFGSAGEDFHRSLALSLSQKIYDFGITNFRVDAAEAQHAMQKHTMDMAEQQLVHDVVAAYYQFNLALAQNRVRDNELELAHEILRQTQIQYEVGVVPRLDVIRAEARVEQARSSYIQQQAQVGDAAAYFFSLLGMDDQRYVPALVTARLSEIGGQPQDLNEAIDAAIALRPELRMQYDALAATKATVHLAKNRPVLEAYGNAMYQEPAGQAGTDAYEYGIQLNWNLYTGGKDRVDRSKAKLTVKSIEESVLNLEAQVELDVTTAWNQVMAARSSARSAQKNLELSSEALRVAAVGYSAGVTPYLDFQDALDQNVAAAIGYVSALAQVKLAQVNLSRASAFPMGYPGDGRAGIPQAGSVFAVLGIEEPSSME